MGAFKNSTRLRKSRLLTIAIIYSIISAACSGFELPIDSEPSLQPNGSFSIDERFRNCYQKLGGLEVIGWPITAAFQVGDIWYQYTENVLLTASSLTGGAGECKLVGLGNELGLEAPAEPVPASERADYINGHYLWEEIMPFLEKHGAAIVGEPLTSVRFDPIENRYEQHFANLGFYRSADQEPGDIHLLPYGAWVCAERCNIKVLQAVPRRMPEPPTQEDLRQADDYFMGLASRLGFNFTGYPLTVSHLASDGLIEKIFENLVFTAPPNNLNDYSFRPLPHLLDINPEEPTASSIEGWAFFATQGGLGYNIPGAFLHYITEHGTREVSGIPITHFEVIGDNVSRQCFTNLCLAFDPNSPESLKIRPMALGVTYYESYTTPESFLLDNGSSQENLFVQIWEDNPMMMSHEYQVIYASIFSGNQPVAGIEFSVIVTMPDGAQRSYVMPPSGENGQTSVMLDLIETGDATQINYQVCPLQLTEKIKCMNESFFIWKSP